MASVLRLVTAEQRAKNEAQEDRGDEILGSFSLHTVKSNFYLGQEQHLTYG